MWIENLVSTVWDLSTLACGMLLLARSLMSVWDWYKAPGNNTRIHILVEDSGETVKWDIIYGGRSLKGDYYIQLTDGNVKVVRGQRQVVSSVAPVTKPTRTRFKEVK